MIMCVLLCYPVSIHMSQLLSTGRPISSFELMCYKKEKIYQNPPKKISYLRIFYSVKYFINDFSEKYLREKWNTSLLVGG